MKTPFAYGLSAFGLCALKTAAKWLKRKKNGLPILTNKQTQN